jgi:hypothetical protein
MSHAPVVTDEVIGLTGSRGRRDETMNVALRIAGILLAALGLLVVLLAFYSPDLAVSGLDLDTGVSLLLGGIIVLGLSGVVAAVEDLRGTMAGEDPRLAPLADKPRRSTEPAAVDAAASPAAKPAPEPAVTMAGDVAASRTPVPPPPDERRSPFDTGKSIESRLQHLDEESRSAIDRVVEEVREHGAAANDTEVVSEENLYVVEEREIAGKQARVLSDGTVEAETDEGWMRFENPEHLEEYMAAMNVQAGRG